jgi:DNA-binding NarL/FixJ family response regulator
MTIYLVEDSEALRERFAREFASIQDVELAGFAESANEAVRGIKSTRPHLVVLDLHLAQGTGMDVLSAMKDWEVKPLIYVLSNAADDLTRSLCARAGASRFFDKSTELDPFFDAVAKLAAEG